MRENAFRKLEPDGPVCTISWEYHNRLEALPEETIYQELEKLLQLQNVCNLCACITYPNPASIAFHETFGYRTIAHFHNSGYKLDKWYDMIWMEKELTPHQVPPLPFIPYPQVCAQHGKEHL